MGVHRHVAGRDEGAIDDVDGLTKPKKSIFIYQHGAWFHSAKFRRRPVDLGFLGNTKKTRSDKENQMT